MQAPPSDRPGRLDGIAGRFGVAADDERDARHRDAVLGHQPRKSRLVTLGSEADRSDRDRCVLHGDARHVR
jgi:hypothetical protein